MEKIREETWSKRLGTALAIGAKIVEGLEIVSATVPAAVPVAKLLKAALAFGATQLNPKPSISDLQKEFIKTKEVNKLISEDTSRIRDVVQQTFLLVADGRYKDGWEKIDSAYDVFVKNSSTAQFDDMKYYMFEFETLATQNLASKRIQAYLEIIHKQGGGLPMSQAVMEYVILVHIKFLQIMVAYHIVSEYPEKVTAQFELFNAQYVELIDVFKSVTGDDFKPATKYVFLKKTEVKPAPRSSEQTQNASLQPNLELRAFLEKNGLSELEDTFLKKGVELSDILGMGGTEMEEVGIKLYKHRRLLSKAIEEHVAKDSPIMKSKPPPSSGQSKPPPSSGQSKPPPSSKQEQNAEAISKLDTKRFKANEEHCGPCQELQNFERKVEGETVLTTNGAVPREILPGPTTLKALAPPAPTVVPRVTRVRGVRWTGEPGKPGEIVFPRTFSGKIETEVATSEYLAYYGAKIATDNEEEINVDKPHCQADFLYDVNYRTKYVEGVAGASLERHNFCHMDTPKGHHIESGHFVIGKFEDSLETVIALTAFQVPQGITIYIPEGVIHTNNYLLGEWKTMLTVDQLIDEAKMMKNDQPFSFTFGNGAVESVEEAAKQAEAKNRQEEAAAKQAEAKTRQEEAAKQAEAKTRQEEDSPIMKSKPPPRSGQSKPPPRSGQSKPPPGSKQEQNAEAISKRAREEDGNIAVAYAFHKLVFKVAEKVTKRPRKFLFWELEPETKREKVKFDKNDRDAIKNVFGRHKALMTLKQEGVISKITYVQ